MTVALKKKIANQKTNLQKIEFLKRQLKELDALEMQTKSKLVKPSKKKAPNVSTPNKTLQTTTTKKQPLPKENTTDQKRYEKRKPLNKEEAKFISDLWYTGEAGYAGRDVFYQKLKRIYEKNNTPQAERISRRRLWMWLSSQETNQVHRDITKHSIEIKPVVAKVRFEKAQLDLVIKSGQDSTNSKPAILTFIDVGTRMAFVRILKGMKQTDSIKAVDSILKEALNLLSPEDIKYRTKRFELGKSKTWSTIHCDNGSEFGKDFTAFLESKNIRVVKGQANRSTSQGMIERFNRSIQSSMQREITSTGARWWDILDRHCKNYNNKTNRNLKLKKEGDKTFTIYTPNELFREDRKILAQLHDNKISALGKANKRYGIEKEIEVGQIVRIVIQSKRKKALNKGFTPNWSFDLYEVYKIKPPPGGDDSVQPYLFFVKNKESGEKKKESLTIQDIQLVNGDVEKPPKSLRVKEKIGVTTRNQTKLDAQQVEILDTPKNNPKKESKPNIESEPKTTSKSKASPSDDELIGRSVSKTINHKEKEYSVTGKIVNKQRRKKGAVRLWYYRLEWSKTHENKWDYKEFNYIKKSEIKRC